MVELALLDYNYFFIVIAHYSVVRNGVGLFCVMSRFFVAFFDVG